MESTNLESQPKFSREVRVGLVAYSGISLAIYMSGVCQEFYQAVRGRGVYKLLKALIDADVVVDIVSGTSAGGINGVLLSYALTNSTATETVDFNAFNEVWHNSGDIYRLLRQPQHQPTTAITSLLDGDGYYQQQLEATFVQAFQQRIAPPEREWVSPFPELDLFITGTDFWGKTYRTFDDSGAITEVKDHRGLFHLKHRQGRKEPFNPLWPSVSGAKPQHTFQALAKLCRLTSALPVFFPTVQVDLNDPSNLVDQYLAQWGKLDQRQWQHRTTGKQLSFLDGGLLDNTPFIPAVREMYYRTPDRLTQRVLFYIDPMPQQSAPNPADTPQLPHLLQTALLEIPMYQSVMMDLRQIQEHNQKVQRYQTLLHQAEEQINTPSPLELSSEKSIYLRSRLVNLRTQALSTLLRLSLGSDTNRRMELDRLSHLLTHQQVSAAVKSQREQCLQAFTPQLVQLDVDYSLRQQFYLMHKIQACLLTAPTTTERAALETLAHQVGQNIQLLEVIKTSLHQLFSNPIISANFYAMLAVKQSDRFLRPLIYEYIFRLQRYLLDVQALPLLLPSSDELFPDMDAMVALSEFLISLPLVANENPIAWLPTAQISTVWQQLQQKIDILATAASHGQYLWNKNRFHYDQRGNQRFLSMLTQIESATIMLLHNSPSVQGRSLLQQFQNFESLDRVLYPVEYLADLGEKEAITTVRISPANAQMGFGQGKQDRDKLAGDSLYACGGFFKKSWRANDLLWGRLDGLNRILEGLINPETVKYFSGLVQRESARLALTPHAYLEFLLQESLPHVTDLDRQRLLAHLTYLAQPNLHITPEKLRYMLNDIVLAGQRQILTTNLDQVFPDEMAPAKAWGTAYALTPDPLQSSMMKMAQHITQESLHHLMADREEFFRQQYRVGSEKLFENIPGMVWVNLATRFVLILRDLLLNAGGQPWTERIRQNWLYRVVDRLLQRVYWWLQSHGMVLMVQLARRRYRLLGQSLLAILVAEAVFFAPISPWVCLGVGVVSLGGWWLGDRHQKQHPWRQPRLGQRLLTTQRINAD